MKKFLLAFCILLFAARGEAAFVQEVHNSAFGSSPIDVTLTATSGNLLIAFGSYGNSAGAITFSTTAGTTSAWTSINSVNGFGFGAIAWASVSASGSTTVRAALTSASFWGISSIKEYSGLDTSAPIDGSACNIASGTTIDAQTSGNLSPTTAADGDTIVADAFDINGGATAYSAGTGFTARSNWTPNSGQYVLSEDLVQTAHGTIAGTMTNIGAGVVGPLCAAAFKSGGGAAPVRMLTLLGVGS